MNKFTPVLKTEASIRFRKYFSFGYRHSLTLAYQTS